MNNGNAQKIKLFLKFLGSYSLGGGVRFDEFTHLPAGFIIENVDTTSDQLFVTSKKDKTCPVELV